MVPEESIVSVPAGTCPIRLWQLADTVVGTNQENSEGGTSSLVWLCLSLTAPSPGVFAIFVHS